MGFIEDLRKQKATEAEAWRQESLRKQKTSEEIRQAEEKERNRIRQLVHSAKAQFDESGVKVLIDRLLKIDGLRFEEVIDWYGKEETYRCKVVLAEYNPGNRFANGSSVSETSIRISTTHDGKITFEGGDIGMKTQSKGFLGRKVVNEITVPLEITINKDKWKGNKGILEDALGRAHKNPHNFSYTPSPYTGDAGGRGGG